MTTAPGTMPRPPSTKGSRAVWRGTWGGFDDARTRLSRRRDKHLLTLVLEYGALSPAQREQLLEREQLPRRKHRGLTLVQIEEDYAGVFTTWQRDKAVRIAEFFAQADKVKATMGSDPKSTIRTWTKLYAFGSNGESRLAANCHGHGDYGDDPLASLLQRPRSDES